MTEIKRTDIQSEDKSVVYKWIVIQKQSENPHQVFNRFGLDEGLITVLTFQSMESTGENQTRTFAEGILEWNAKKVDFNGEKMARIEPSDLPLESLELIERFLA